MGEEKEKQDKGLPSQVTPAQSLLPAVRAVSRRPRRGQNGERTWRLGSGIPMMPVFQKFYRGSSPRRGPK